MAQREPSIDVTKGLLVQGMVLAHCIQFLGDNSFLLKFLSTALNLVSFSGFMFCFGYAYWCAYVVKPEHARRRSIRTAIKCYLAFVISGIAFRFAVSAYPFQLKWMYEIIVLRDVPGYSEFLIAFSLVVIVSQLFPRLILLTTKTANNAFFTLAICSISIPLIPQGKYDPWLGLLIGGEGFSYFPVMQYFPVFILGVFFARYQVGMRQKLIWPSAIFMMSLLAIDPYGNMIDRFPPSAAWIIGSMGGVYCYFWISQKLKKYQSGWFVRYSQGLGRQALLYLLVTNLIFFTAYAIGAPRQLNAMSLFIVYICLMVTMLILQSAWVRISSIACQNKDGAQ